MKKATLCSCVCSLHSPLMGLRGQRKGKSKRMQRKGETRKLRKPAPFPLWVTQEEPEAKLATSILLSSVYENPPCFSLHFRFIHISWSADFTLKQNT